MHSFLSSHIEIPRMVMDVDSTDEENAPRSSVYGEYLQRGGQSKEIMSATKTLVSTEGILQDEDFRTTITRDELFAAARGRQLFTRAMESLVCAVESSG